MLMIKSGMVGYRRELRFGVGEQGVLREVVGEVMYIDGGMNLGASGGAVVNGQGEAVGIMTDRAWTSVSYRDQVGLQVPSGSTVALSVRAMEGLRLVELSPG